MVEVEYMTMSLCDMLHGLDVIRLSSLWLKLFLYLAASIKDERK